MAKKCFSVKEDSFDKVLKKNFDHQRIKKIYDRIKELENAENEFLESTEKARAKLNQFGKSLSAINKSEIYCLELGTDRILAMVVEDENKKVYAWFWGGPHEKYNNEFRHAAKNKKGPNISDEEINAKSAEIDAENKKAGVIKNINVIRDKSTQNEDVYEQNHKSKVGKRR